MTDTDILARLIAQAEGQGADMVTLRAIIEEAVELGVRRACRVIDDEGVPT